LNSGAIVLLKVRCKVKNTEMLIKVAEQVATVLQKHYSTENGLCLHRTCC